MQIHNVSYNTEPFDSFQSGYTVSGSLNRKLCPMPIQKETPAGLIDTVCNGDIEENHAGLCK